MIVSPLSYAKSSNGVYIRMSNKSKSNDILILANFDTELAEIKTIRKSNDDFDAFLINAKNRLLDQYDYDLILN